MKVFNFSRAVVVGLLAAQLIACHDATGPNAKVAGLRLVSGDGQSAAAGTTLASAPTFVAFDASGTPISDVKFSVSVSSGGGRVSDSPARTSGASTSVGAWTLGPHAGVNTITVSVSGVSPLTISATGVAGAATRIVPLTPITVSGRAGEAVATAIAARVTDTFENPVAGASVSLSTTAGTAPLSVTADSTGSVSISGWILGPLAGQNALTLRAGSAALSFIATVLPGDAVNLVPVDTAAASGLAGAVLSPLRLRLTDKFGNAVGFQQLTLAVTAGGGSLASPTAASDVDGIVVLAGWTLGRSALPQVVHASSATLNADVAAVVRSDFHVDVRFFGPDMTPDQKALFTTAAARISAVIVGAISDVTYGGLSASAVCGVPGLPTLDETIHSIVIFASVQPIDGPGAILAESGPCLLRSGSGFPSIAVMLFDVEDLAGMASRGILQDVITHEMLHSVGFGTIWDQKGVLAGAGTATSAFTGPRARQGCVDDGGAATCANSVPVENDGIPGTADAHWRESVFGSELMTGFANSGGMPLSAITVGSLADIGYVVNLFAADPYVVPSPANQDRIPSPAVPWERRIQPRAPPPT